MLHLGTAALLSNPMEVSFRAIDTDAAEDDSPYSTHILSQIRQNIEHTRKNRVCSVAITSDYDEPPELSGLWPVPYGPFRVYSPGGVRERQIRLRLRLGSVVLQSASEGEDAIRFCITSIAPDGRFITPPERRQDWPVVVQTREDGHETVTIPLSGPNLSPPGWVGIVLWVWSEVDDVLLDSGDVANVTAPWSFEGDFLSNSPTNEFLTHWAVKFIPPSGSPKLYQPANEPDGPWHTVASVYNDGSDLTYFLIPPIGFQQSFTTPLARVWQYEVYGLGFTQLLGIEMEVEPNDPQPPSRSAYASGKPIRGDLELPLVSAVDTLVRTRVPTWGGMSRVERRLEHRGVPNIAGGAARFTTIWYGLYAGPGDYDETLPDDTTPKDLCSVLLQDDVPDSGGYTAIISFQSIGINSVVPPILDFRFQVYNAPAGTSQRVSQWVTADLAFDWDLSTGAGAPDDQNWSGTVLAFLGQARTAGYWQYLGSLLGQPGDWARELKRLQTIQFFWSPTSALTYPCELRLEYKINDQSLLSRIGAVYFADCWIASAQRVT